MLYKCIHAFNTFSKLLKHIFGERKKKTDACHLVIATVVM